MLQEPVTHGLDPILQPPVVSLQSLDKGVKGINWSRYQLRSELCWSRRSCFSRARPSNSCHQQTRQGGGWVTGSASAEETR
jgi:hypothetical protein